MAEGFKMSCPRCGQSYRFNDAQLVKFAGKTLACRKCRKAFTVPKIQVAAPEPAPPPAPAPPPEEPVLRDEEERQPVTTIAIPSRLERSEPEEESESRDDRFVDDTPFRKERYSRPRIEPQLDLQARPDDIHHGIFHDEPTGREPGGFNDTGAYRAPVGYDDLPPQTDYHPGVFDDEAHDDSTTKAAEENHAADEEGDNGEDRAAAAEDGEHRENGEGEETASPARAGLSVIAREEAEAADAQSEPAAEVEGSSRIEEEERRTEASEDDGGLGRIETETPREESAQEESAKEETAQEETAQEETALARRQRVIAEDEPAAAEQPAGEFLQPPRPPVREPEVASPRPAPERPAAPVPPRAPSRPPRAAAVVPPLGYDQPTGAPFSWGDFFAFRSMIALPVIQGLFWLGVLGCVIGGAAQIYNAFNPSPAAPAMVNGVVVAPTAATPRVATSYDAAMLVTGLLTLFLGPLLVRIFCEILIVIFRINETLTEIRRELQGKP